MRVVSDTSTLSNLAIIGHLPLLQAQFSTILIPPAVWTELGRLRHTDAVYALSKAQFSGFIEIRQVSRFDADSLALMLDRGEAEAIALAREVHADLLLIDERDGRKIARELGLTLTGVLGVLLRAKADGRILSVAAEIEALRLQAGFFVSTDLERHILEMAGE